MNKGLRWIPILLLVLLFGAEEVAGSSAMLFQRLPAEEGWPQGEVNALLRDEKGYVWMGTASGLTCFDGFRCHTFSIGGSRDSGRDYSIHGLMLDAQGRLWMMAGEGFIYFDRGRRAFARNVEGLWRRCGMTKAPCGMATDARGRLYAAVDGEGLYRIEGEGEGALCWPFGEELRGEHVTDLTAAGGRLWVAFSSGVMAWCDVGDGTSWRIYRQMAHELPEGVKMELKLMADAQGDVWAYSIYGVWRYDLRRGEMSCVERTEQGDFVRVMAQDAMQRIWVGRDRSGLRVMVQGAGEGLQLMHDAADVRSLPENTVTALACCADSAVLVGTYRHGVALYHPHLYPFEEGMRGEVNALVEVDGEVVGRSGEVVSMLYGRDSTLWVGTFREGLKAYRGGEVCCFRHEQGVAQGLSCDNVWALAEDSCGAIWIATLGGGLQRYEPDRGRWTTFCSGQQGGLADDYLASLALSRRGGLWIGMASKGFAFMRLDDGRITHYGGTRRGHCLLHCPYVNQLCEDSRGWLWLATRNGVEIYLPDEDELLQLSLPEGCTTFAAAVAEDAWGAMWIALGRELLRVEVDVRARRFSPTCYGEAEGLTTGVLNQRALCRLSDGRMAAGGTEGLCLFDPRAMRSRYTLRTASEGGTAWGSRMGLVGIGLLGLVGGAMVVVGWRKWRRGQRMAVLHRSQPKMEPQVSYQPVESLDERLVARATAYVEANMERSELTVEELSRELAMSRGHLYKRLTQLTGLTPVEFIRSIRLQRAAQLLKRSGLTVAEVAYRVGFNNPKYFSRYFKEAYGMLPSAYRISSKEEKTVENSTSDNLSGYN